MTGLCMISRIATTLYGNVPRDGEDGSCSRVSIGVTIWTNEHAFTYLAARHHRPSSAVSATPLWSAMVRLEAPPCQSLTGGILSAFSSCFATSTGEYGGGVSTSSESSCGRSTGLWGSGTSLGWVPASWEVLGRGGSWSSELVLRTRSRREGRGRRRGRRPSIQRR